VRAITDFQKAKGVQKGPFLDPSGYDAGKMVNGRTRDMLKTITRHKNIPHLENLSRIDQAVEELNPTAPDYGDVIS